MWLEAVIYIMCVGPGIPILSYLYKSGIRPLITPGHQSEIDNKSLWKTCFQTDKKDSKEQRPLKINS